MTNLQLPLMVPLKILTLEKGTGDMLRGTAELLNAKFYLEAVKVTYEDLDEVEGVETTLQIPVNDPLDRLYALEQYVGEDKQFVTVELPGHEGEWVLSLTPLCD